MTNTVLIKRSGTANAVPTSGQLSLGELAINYNDGNLFYKNAVGSVTLLTSNQFVSVAGNVTGGNILTSGLISASSNISGGNLLTTGKLTSGAVTYTNVDGLADQVLATYGNGVTYFKSVSSGGSGYLRVYLRAGGYVNIDTTLGYLNVVGRTGNITVFLTP